MPTFTTAQKNTLKAFILADPTLGPMATSGNYDGITTALNALASPDFWCWRTSVSRSEIYNLTSPDATTWNWATYKAQNVTEQNAWVQMFMGDQADFSQDNLRAGVVSIFSGSAPANAQQAHILAMGRRKATLCEKLLATGTGSTASPAKFSFQGSASVFDIGFILS